MHPMGLTKYPCAAKLNEIGSGSRLFVATRNVTLAVMSQVEDQCDNDNDNYNDNNNNNGNYNDNDNDNDNDISEKCKN